MPNEPQRPAEGLGTNKESDERTMVGSSRANMTLVDALWRNLAASHSTTATESGPPNAAPRTSSEFYQQVVLPFQPSASDTVSSATIVASGGNGNREDHIPGGHDDVVSALPHDDTEGPRQ